MQIDKKPVSNNFDSWSLFLYSIKSPITKKKYCKRLESFLNFIGCEGNAIENKAIDFVDKSNTFGKDWVFNQVLKFMQFQINRVNHKQITGSTVQNYVKSIKLFTEVADIYIPWKKITRGLPKGRKYADDRIPTNEEIEKLFEYPDRRINSIIYVFTSSGIRLGAWDYLRWGHIRPITKESKIVAAKVIVYAGEEESFSVISEEAYQELSRWMQYRQLSGEKIDENSWVMCDLWDTRAIIEKARIPEPKEFTSNGIKRLINRAMWAQGLRKIRPR